MTTTAPRHDATASDEVVAIDALAAAFYALFDNRQGLSPLLDSPQALFLHDAVIVRRDGDVMTAMSLDAFLTPRRRWLSDGTLVDFHEFETQSRTFVADGIATRLSRYRKQGQRDDQRIDGEGAKSLHLVRTEAGWRIASVVWQDGDDVAWREAAP
ncbi:DUF4440 domain-containing protein [Cognatilysobacter terrigena]|uniref:DUF4440 domain-containing protein n=1 Tax=Cognatilysobacter terrigena TaxID=2488749 RepID=UPI00105BE225|nr:DUF4440 domain-containing protein [Lysobacter terrigena]